MNYSNDIEYEDVVDDLEVLYLWGEEWERCMVDDNADRAEWVSEEMANLIEKIDHLMALDALAAETYGATFVEVQERFPFLEDKNV